MYKVYEITPRLGCYTGLALVAANNVEDANCYIDAFKKRDENNIYDSNGYNFVNDRDRIPELYSTSEGIILYGIYYRG